MPTVNGTLKYFSPTRDGLKATLTGEWDDGEKKHWVTWDEAKPLRDERLVFKSKTEKWEDGSPKWMVDGEPSVAIIKTFNGKGVPPTCKVVLNGGAGNGASHDAPNPSTPVSSGSYDQVERDLQVAFAVASKVWKKMLEGGLPDDATLQATAATVFIEANKKGLHGTPVEEVAPGPVGGYEDKPEALEDEDPDDLPF